MKRLLTALWLTAVSTAALAQAQQPAADPAFLQKVLGAIQAQRNSALDAQAVAEARIASLMEENAKLKARVDELEKKPAPPPAE